MTYRNSTASVQRFNATVQNTGSVGCVYRFHASIASGNSSHVRTSRPATLAPGEGERLRLVFIPYNTTGTVSAAVNLTYCGRSDPVATFNFTAGDKAGTYNVTAETATGANVT
ncbi:MAG: hypothetical protein ABEK12_00650, partial [Candidatus Nanohaloarchaea archaeon]